MDDKNKYPKCNHCDGTKFHYEGDFTIDAEWDDSFGEMVFVADTMSRKNYSLVCSTCHEIVYEDDLKFPPKD